MPVRILAVSESSSHRILLPGDEILAIGGQAVDKIDIRPSGRAEHGAITRRHAS
jgi:hypothetical protein